MQESRIRNYRLPAAVEFARVNRLNYVSLASPRPRVGIVTMGKSWRDVRQALVDLGISEQQAADLGGGISGRAAGGVLHKAISAPRPRSGQARGEAATGGFS